MEGEPLCQITGSWLKNVEIDGKEYWKMDEVRPFPQKCSKNALPSDWRYREDLIWLKYKN